MDFLLKSQAGWGGLYRIVGWPRVEVKDYSRDDSMRLGFGGVLFCLPLLWDPRLVECV